MGVEWGGRNERPRKQKDNSAGAKALGWDPQTGWGPGLGVNSMPGAPGANDAAIFAAARERRLQQSQFGPVEPAVVRQNEIDRVAAHVKAHPDDYDEDGLPKGWQGKPPTSEEMGY